MGFAARDPGYRSPCRRRMRTIACQERNYLDRGAAVTMDVWIAAIATHHQLTVVTRNTRDFEPLGVPVFDPWREG